MKPFGMLLLFVFTAGLLPTPTGTASDLDMSGVGGNVGVTLPIGK